MLPVIWFILPPKKDFPSQVQFQYCKKDFSYKLLLSTISTGRLINSSSLNALFQDGDLFKREGAHVLSPNISSPTTKTGLLDAYDDDYDRVIIDPECLPSSANAFVSILRASLSDWKREEGFSYHQAEPEYVMLTYWIPNGPCMLPDSPLHQIGIGGFVMNDKGEVLVVKEKQCPCYCSGVWKLPTGFINKIDTIFLEIVAFRHVHRMAFEKSDLFFVCMLKPLSFEIMIDEKEIEAAKWMPLEELFGQPFYQEDHMLKKAIDVCVATHEKRYSGYTPHQLMSKFDGQLSHLYYNDKSKL